VSRRIASRLGWLPCGESECVNGFVSDGFDGLHERYVECSSCNGVGWLPSPTVLEAMAEAIHTSAWEAYQVQARAAWEAQARLVLEGEK